MSETPPLTEENTSRFLTTKLHKIHYNEAGSGHPVVLLHGSGPGATGWSNFSPNIGPLSKRFRVLAFDMPGWGQTQELEPDPELDHVQALILALDELGIEQASLIGNSMGGMTSVRAAIEHPDRITHVIPMGAPSPGINLATPGGGLSEGLKILAGAYEDPSPANFKRLVSVMAYNQAFATDDLAEQRSRNALSHPEHLTSWNRLMSSKPMGKYFSLAGQLSQIAAPTLVIHGRDDRTVHYENGLRLTTMIPNSRMVIFNHCGHWAQLEHADEFNHLVEQFILTH
jgi:2-hydroxy-6-oxonona-2,4-dienedioate hydrolase